MLLWAEQPSWLVLLFRNVPGEGLSLHSFFFLLFFVFMALRGWIRGSWELRQFPRNSGFLISVAAPPAFFRASLDFAGGCS